MTREEAINWLDRLYMGADITDEYGDMENVQPYEEALNMAIKALEQESILDDIRAEIEGIELLANYTRGDIKRMALDIIDKYKAGSEDKK